MRESLFNSELPSFKIKREDLYFKYKKIGFGQEADVYRYSDKVAFKLFEIFNYLKFKKIELLSSLNDPSFLFPEGLVGFSSCFQEGYYMDNVNFGCDLHDFDDLKYLYDLKRKLTILKKGCDAIKRAHKMGIIIGDIKGENILIDEEDNPRFCDTDNYRYEDYDFDLTPTRSTWLSCLYKEDFSSEDNDKFVYALLSLAILTNQDEIILSKNEIKNAIKLLDSNILREGFREILSDSNDKPYVDEVLNEINLEENVILRHLPKH